MLTFTRSFVLTLLLLSAGIAVAACGGSKADPSADATKVADAPALTSFDLVAKGNKFDQKVLVAKAGSEIKVSLKNEDGGVLHNFAIYKNSKGKENLYRGEVFEGKKTVLSTFTAPEAGAYYFRCDVHPDTMDGSFITK